MLSLLPPAWSAPGVVLDGSFGASGALAGPNYIIPASAGKQVGGNLFQSFSQFNLINTESATFTSTGSTGSINNILARVTGGSSSIDGTINSQIPRANLFLLNPAGVMFGAHAQVNVSGSFVVSTANYAKLSDGTVFYGDVNHPIADQGLTSAPISAFGFLSATPAPVSFAGTQITMPTGSGLHVIAGNITIDQGSADGVTQRGTTLSAPSGNLTLFSAASAGEVPFSLTSPGSGYASATNPSFGNITIQNQSKVAIDGAGGGSMVIRGGQLVVNNSTVSSANSGSTAGGNISVQASQVTLEAGGLIASYTTSTGQGGAIDVTTDMLTITGKNQSSGDTGITSLSGSAATSSVATGSGGAINVNVTGTADITNAGGIIADTYSADANTQSGNVEFQAANLMMSGSTDLPGIDNPALFAVTHGAAQGGSMDVMVDQNLTLNSSGAISTSTYAAGNGGDMTVHAGTLSVDGSEKPGANQVTGLFDNAQAGSSGSSGNLTLTVDGAATLTNSGRIAARSFGTGNGGTITVTAASLDLSNNSLISAGAELPSSPTSLSHAGSITIDVTNSGPLSLEKGAEIESDTLTSGAGGSIFITAGSLSIDGQGDTGKATGILSTAGSSSAATAATGQGGSIQLTIANATTLVGGGEIDVSTYSDGQAGTINLQTGSLSIDSANNQTLYSGVFADSGSATVTDLSGNAGSITVNVTGALTLTSTGIISNGTFSSGNAGPVSVTADTIYIDAMNIVPPSNKTSNVGGTGIFSNADAGAMGSAGSVNVVATQDLKMENGGSISTATFSSGNAGDMTVSVTSGTMEIDGDADPVTGISLATGLFTNAVANSTGTAGNLAVTVAEGLEMSGLGRIAARTFGSGNGGNILVTAGTLTMSGLSRITAGAELRDATSPAMAGSVTLNVNGTLSITDGAQIETDTYSSEKAGDIIITADSLVIDGSAAPTAPTGIVSNTGLASGNKATAGNAGSITVNVNGAAMIKGAGVIETNTYDAGNAGTINLVADSLTIDGSATPTVFTGISSDAGAQGAQSTAKGAAGTIVVNISGATSITGTGAISTSTYDNGDAGGVTVTTDSLSIDGAADPSDFTGISSNTGSVGSLASDTGNAGSVTVTVTNDLSLTDGGGIEASTSTAGAGGIVTVNANTLEIVGATSTTASPTGILAETAGTNHGGSVVVTVQGALAISNNGGIETSTTSTSKKGTAGDITVIAGSTVLNGGANATTSSYRSGILSISKTGASGNAGTVDLTVNGALTIEDGASISVSTFASGAGGNIVVGADSILIQGLGADSVNLTGIFAGAHGTGSAGSVTINIEDLLSLTDAGQISSSSSSLAAKAGAGGNVTINGQGDIDLTGSSEITASSANSVAGTIDITTTGTLTLDSSSSISTASDSASGGNITLNIGREVYLLDSNITSEADGPPTGNLTSGGNITIDPQFVVLNNSFISANDPGGTGGDIQMISNFLFTSNTLITATGTTAGTVTTPAPDLNLAASLIVQPAELEKGEKQLRERCARSLGHDFSSLIVVGRGGVESAPDELQSDFGTGSIVMPATASGAKTP